MYNTLGNEETTEETLNKVVTMEDDTEAGLEMDNQPSVLPPNVDCPGSFKQRTCFSSYPEDLPTEGVADKHHDLMMEDNSSQKYNLPNQNDYHFPSGNPYPPLPFFPQQMMKPGVGPYQQPYIPQSDVSPPADMASEYQYSPEQMMMMMMSGIGPSQHSQFGFPTDVSKLTDLMSYGSQHLPEQSKEYAHIDSKTFVSDNASLPFPAQIPSFMTGEGTQVQQYQPSMSKGVSGMELLQYPPADPNLAQSLLHQNLMMNPNMGPVVKVKNYKNCNFGLSGSGGTSTQVSQLGNIIDSTNELIKHYDTSSHVSTFAERDALKKLKDRGCIFINGRAGTGKTRIGVHILANIAREKKRTPIYLTSALDWNLIPKFQPRGEKGKGQKYVVMVDDVFGSSALVQSALDEWEKMFEFMWPSVESEQIYLVLTSRTDVSSKCQCRVKKYSIMKNIQTIELDEGSYVLKPDEKKKLISNYCGRFGLTKEEIEEICHMKTLLGFPQCCVDFAKNRNVKDRKSDSLGVAYHFLAADINTLKENDPLGYFVLLLILMNGCLDVKKLERPTKEFKDEVDRMSDICSSLDSTPSCKTIKDKVIHFCGIYLSKTGTVVRFLHEKVYNAVFLEVASTHLDLFLNTCPAKTLVEFVRTSNPDDPKDPSERRFVYIKGDMYGEFTERVIQILLEDDGTEILDHSAFFDDKFINVFLNRTNTNTRIQIATRNIKEFSIDQDVFDLEKIDLLSTQSIDEILRTTTMIQKRERIFTYSHQISLMILKRLSYLANSLLFTAGGNDVPVAILNEALTCAIHVNDCQIVAGLLERGVIPSVSTMKALCCVQDADQNITEKIFQKMKWDSTCQKAHMMSLAVQNGNTKAVFLLRDLLVRTEEGMKTFELCLTQLMYQCSNIIPDARSMLITDKHVAEIMDILLNTACSYDQQLLVCLAAGHNDSRFLKRLLTVTSLTLSESQSRECLKQASLYGSSGCLEECLRNEALGLSGQAEKSKAALLHYCSRSAKDSHLKLKILMETTKMEEGLGVDVTDERGNAPLHFAAMRGDPICVQVLLQAGADADIENAIGVTPLQCAAVTKSLECMKSMLKSENPVDKNKTVIKFCFHEPSRKFVYDKYESQYPDLTVANCSPSQRDINAIIGSLLKYGFKLDKPDSDGQTCLFQACHNDTPSVFLFLCGRTKELKTVDSNGWTILHEAAEFGDFSMVEHLCERGAKVDVKDGSGQTVVHAAAASRRETVQKLQYLIDVKKADVKAEDKRGRTVLFPAVETGDEEVVEYLVGKGLNLKKADAEGTTLVEIAKKHQHESLQNRVLYRRLSTE